MVVASGAQEADAPGGVGVGQPPGLGEQTHLVGRRRQVQRTLQTHRFGNAGQQVLDGVRADRGKHRGAVGISKLSVVHGGYELRV